LSTDGAPKITDFGLAKLVDVEHGPTRSEAVIGTPSYMSPEQALGNARLIGVPSDVYSLGAIHYELLTGRAPFCGNTMLQTLEQVRTQDAIPPRRLRRDVSRDLETICLKCLEKGARQALRPRRRPGRRPPPVFRRIAGRGPADSFLAAVVANGSPPTSAARQGSRSRIGGVLPRNGGVVPERFRTAPRPSRRPA
jgi:serine/threonine protein kinase